jgi:hypothetical protein
LPGAGVGVALVVAADEAAAAVVFPAGPLLV